MRAACQQLRAWRDAGLPPVVVSVNMSAIEFNQSNLLTEVQQVLTDTGIDPQWLEIELTETTLMKQSEHVLGTLEALQQLGVRLAIDDFGTGYSSLAYLKRYPLDKLKIDRAFIKDTPQDQDDVSLVTAIIQMARSLNLRTVAEGVESESAMELAEASGLRSDSGLLPLSPHVCRRCPTLATTPLSNGCATISVCTTHLLLLPPRGCRRIHPCWRCGSTPENAVPAADSASTLCHADVRGRQATLPTRARLLPTAASSGPHRTQA